MLNEREKKELLDMAASSEIREDSRRMRAAARGKTLDDADFAAALEFLTSVSEWNPGPPRRLPRTHDRNILL